MKLPFTAELCLTLYRHGMFPMAESATGPIMVFQPPERAILVFQDLRISRSLRRALRQPGLEVKVNTAFDQVIRACAARQDTWISEDIIHVYRELHFQRHVHSVETWIHDELVGGLYGVTLGGVFFGESMFHRKTDASKIALVELVHRLRSRGFAFLEVQYMTSHLASMGASLVSHDRYMEMLQSAMLLECRFDEKGEDDLAFT